MVGLSDQVRSTARVRFVQPALQSGTPRFSIRVKDLLSELQNQGFPGSHTPQVCSAIQSSKFLRENGLELEGVDGPPSKMSTTVVVRYRVAGSNTEKVELKTASESDPAPPGEDPKARAFRLTEKLRGLMKEEFAPYGGGEAFLRWVRSEEEDAA
ncbi:MAG: hypothetical protein ABR928_22170 [Terracidiphilus sp.]|jgi:hypothetical protein